jgi:hypothetical protein
LKKADTHIAWRYLGASMLQENSIHDTTAEQKLDDACRRLLSYCNRMDRRLTTPEIIAALVRTLATEIEGDAHRNNLDVSGIATDYGDLLRNSITVLEHMRSKSQKWK